MSSEDQALRESEYRYRNLFQAMAASFWELDFTGIGGMLRELKAAGVRDYQAHFDRHPDFVRAMMRATRVLDINDQTVVLFGRGDKQEMLTNVEPFWPEAANSVFAASVIAAVTGKPNFSAETKSRRIDGSEFDALFTACFPADSVAKGILLVGVIDISERKRAAEQLRQLQSDLAHAARVSMLGELTASIAHEVSQPLAAIGMNAAAGLRWLDRPQPNLEEARALTASIAADAQRAADIIARIRGMAVHRDPERSALAANDAIHEVLQFLRHELQSQKVEVVLDLPAELPRIAADRIQLHQVLVNLTMNAVQSIAEARTSKRELRVAARHLGEAVEITICDNGVGIAPENLSRLFGTFFSTKANGMGMGLPICRSIVESHGGHIAASNNPEGGACFSFTLPVAN